MSTAVRRVAAKTHQCQWGACRTITPGEPHVLFKTFPGDDDGGGYASHAGHPMTMRLCESCAGRFGYTDLLRGDRLIEALQ